MLTDQPGYIVGSTVQISGSGFAPNEPVTLTVHRATFWREGGEAAHQPFMVAADDAGRISASWVLADGIGVNFRVWAYGAVSGFAQPADINRVAVLMTDRHYYGPNQTGNVFGYGFTPGAAVNLLVEQANIVSGPLTADAQGRVTASFVTDSDPSAATHRVVAMSSTGDAYLAPMAGLSRTGNTMFDDGGPDDETGDADVLYFRSEFRRDVSPRVLDVTIGWDVTWFDGSNYSTIYLDTNHNGRADVAVDTEISGEPLEPQKIAVVYSCTDTSALGCDSFEYRGEFFWQSWNVVNSGDTVQNIPLTLPGLGLPADGAGPTILNVCSTTDCVITPGNGFLTIDAWIPTPNATNSFSFSLPFATAQNGASSWSVTPSPTPQGAIGTLSSISMAPGTYVLNAMIPAGWTITGSKCSANGVGFPTTFDSVVGPAVSSVSNILINPGQVTRCKVTVQRLPTT